MTSDSFDEPNPYVPPDASGTRRLRSRLIPWILVLVGVAMIIFSFPIAWHTLELANQEYFHFWHVRYTVYDIEINGVPVSIDTAIRNLAIETFVLWTFAVVLMFAARKVVNCSAILRKEPSPSN